MSTVDEEPRDQRVRVPHVPGVELVAAPGQCREAGDEVEKVRRLARIAADTLGTVDSRGHIGDQAVAPTPDLVAEPLGSTEPWQSDRADGDHASFRLGSVPHGGRLDHVSDASEVDLECGMVDGAALAVLPCRSQGLVYADALSCDVRTGPQRQPVEVHGVCRRRAFGHAGRLQVCRGCFPRRALGAARSWRLRRGLSLEGTGWSSVGRLQSTGRAIGTLAAAKQGGQARWGRPRLPARLRQTVGCECCRRGEFRPGHGQQRASRRRRSHRRDRTM